MIIKKVTTAAAAAAVCQQKKSTRRLQLWSLSIECVLVAGRVVHRKRKLRGGSSVQVVTGISTSTTSCRSRYHRQSPISKHYTFGSFSRLVTKHTEAVLFFLGSTDPEIAEGMNTADGPKINLGVDVLAALGVVLVEVGSG